MFCDRRSGLGRKLNFAEPRFFFPKFLQWFWLGLEKHALKNGPYLETFFSPKKLTTFEKSRSHQKKNIFFRNFFFGKLIWKDVYFRYWGNTSGSTNEIDHCAGGASRVKTFFEQKKSVKPSLNYPKTIQEHIVIGFVAPQKNRHWLQNRLTRQNML